jgi:hypothetical protein
MPAQPVLLAKDGTYSQTAVKESELESALVKYSKDVFGQRAFYFPVKQKVESATKRRATDGLLLDFSIPKSPRFWLVEVELHEHDMMRTVGPQIKNFLSALKNEETLTKVLNTLFEELRRDQSKYEMIRKLIDPKEEVYHFLHKLLHDESSRGVLIVIDEYVNELDELKEDWFGGQVEVILFRIYERSGNKIYYFTPYVAATGFPEKERKYPETHISWKAAYESMPDSIKTLSNQLIERMEQRFVDVEHGPALTRSWYRFLVKGIKNRKKATFLVFWMTRSHLHLRIGINPKSFEDPKQITKEYKGFFWARLPNTQERGFNIDPKSDLGYATILIEQSYERAKAT